MNKLFLCHAMGLGGALLLSACGNSYTIEGTAEGAVDGDTVYLATPGVRWGSYTYNDSCIVADGKFHFEGSTDYVMRRSIVPVHKGQVLESALDFMIENAHLTFDLKADQTQSTVKGGKNNDIWFGMIAKESEEGEVYVANRNIVRDTTASEQARATAQAVMDSIDRVSTIRHKANVTDNMPGDMAAIMLKLFSYEFTARELVAINNELVAKNPGNPTVAEIKADMEAKADVAVGQKFTDIAQTNFTGDTLRLSNVVAKNKAVLVDFWASWCGPCRAEMPAVVKAYEAYKDKGLEIVGVSLDKDSAAWFKAAVDLKADWLHMSDLQGWQNAAAQTYHVRSIPSNVLIDENGIIYDKDLRGEQLMKAIGELLDK